MKKFLSLLLSMLLLFSASACSLYSPSDNPNAADCLLRKKDYFPKRDFDAAPAFSEIEYEHYSKGRMEPLIDNLYSLCDGEHDSELFETYLTSVLDEFGYADTQQMLLDLNYDMDIKNDAVFDELMYLDETLYELREDYNKAMRALARSANSNLMSTVFSDDEIADFAEYEGSDREMLEIFLEIENKKQRYDELISCSDPDLEAITELFTELIALNKKSALLSGSESFAQQCYSQDFLRPYSPDDAKELWTYVKKYFSPIISDYENKYYSLSKRLLNRKISSAAMSPLNAIKTVAEGSSRELYEAYGFLTDKKLYDIDISENKAAYSYTVSLYSYNVPFIFHCADGTLNDIFTLMHEFGHFVNSAYCDYMYYETDEDIDAAELQAHSAEFLATLFYEDIFGELAPKALTFLILDTAMSVADGAMYDEFLQRAYEEENLTSEKVLDIYKDIYESYGYSSYPGYEYEWCYIPHLFKMPFYYISYCVASLGALQVYGELLKDPRSGAETVMKILSSNNCECNFEALTEKVGLESIFSEDSFDDIAESLKFSLENLKKQ